MNPEQNYYCVECELSGFWDLELIGYNLIFPAVMDQDIKIQVNPYLFLLLKRMLYFEAQKGIESDLPSDHDIANFFYRRLKHQRDNDAFKKKEIIRKELLPFKNNYFSKYHLNLLAQLVTLIDEFASWDEFASKYISDRGARDAQDKYMRVNYVELAQHIKDEINFSIETRIIYLQRRKIMNANKDKYTVIRSDDDFIFRTVGFEEIQSLYVEDVLTDHSNLNENDVDETTMNSFIQQKVITHERTQIRIKQIEDLLKKNPHIGVVCRNQYGVAGYILLLPLKSFAYQDMIDGDININEIKPYQIHDLSERDQVRFIYVLAADYKRKLFPKLLRMHINELIANLSNAKKIVVCAIGRGQIDIGRLESFNFIKIREIDSKTLPQNKDFTKFPLYQKMIDIENKLCNIN